MFVPNAEMFRWEIRSRDEEEELRLGQLCSGIIPANLLTLSSTSERGIEDPWNGLGDITANEYRYIRNGFYNRSPLYQQGRDLEIFSALLFLRLVLEAKASRAIHEHPGIKEATDVIKDAVTSDTWHRLQHYPFLRARLFYLLHDLWAASRSANEFSSLASETSLQTFLEKCSEQISGNLQELCNRLAGTTKSIPVSNIIFTSSSWLQGDTFRLGCAESCAEPDENTTQNQFKEICKEAADGKSDKPSLELGEGQELLWHTPSFSLHEGTAPSAFVFQHAGTDVAVRHEFVHLGILCDALAAKLSDCAEENLTVLTFIRFPEAQSAKSIFIATPAVVEKTAKQINVRVNCFGSFEEAARIASQQDMGQCSAQFFLVALNNS